ncbi:hypothetical protein DPMN_010827 [Dreissena polymorpha]|uniref:Uncharacterized protein n=1 Tax=Dreissena polymorpha TaxID=45954 RepID=A0A9D4RZF0_DREPO|nr:hypothetical protein DPMN_010790 [Dreissena polymorpha]KAH3886814.1 hypothetical protein DPMN_010827 [Dreissena polymorpha]
MTGHCRADYATGDTGIHTGADPGFLVRGGGILKDLLGVQGAACGPLGWCRAKPCKEVQPP